jgi:hypothetical protein
MILGDSYLRRVRKKRLRKSMRKERENLSRIQR